MNENVKLAITGLTKNIAYKAATLLIVGMEYCLNHYIQDVYMPISLVFILVLLACRVNLGGIFIFLCGLLIAALRDSDVPLTLLSYSAIAYVVRIIRS